MPVELFDRNAYAVLGLALDGSSADIGPAFAKAQQQRRAKAQQIGSARQELANVGTRLALDALTMLPPVPERVLAEVAGSAPAVAPAPSDVDPIEALLLLPEVELSVRSVEAPRLAPRQDLLGEPILAPEIER